MQGLVGDEECTWQAFEGGGGVSMTCLASAGSRRVAVGGTGGCMEIWDVEMACGGGLGAGGGRAGLVHRLVRVSIGFFSFFFSFEESCALGYVTVVVCI